MKKPLILLVVVFATSLLTGCDISESNSSTNDSNLSSSDINENSSSTSISSIDSDDDLKKFYNGLCDLALKDLTYNISEASIVENNLINTAINLNSDDDFTLILMCEKSVASFENVNIKFQYSWSAEQNKYVDSYTFNDNYSYLNFNYPESNEQTVPFNLTCVSLCESGAAVANATINLHPKSQQIIDDHFAERVIEKAFSMNTIATTLGTPVSTELVANLYANSNDGLSLAIMQNAVLEGTSYLVNFSYSWGDEFESYIKDFTNLPYDETHKLLTFAYPSQGSNPVTFTFTATGSFNNREISKNYSVSLVPSTIIFDDLSLQELYRLNDDGNNFFFIGEDGKIIKNHDNNHFFLTTRGKLTYVSPNGNWGLIGDGEYSAKLYRLDQFNGWYNLEIGKYYEIDCQLANAWGNVELSWISRIDELTGDAASEIAEPVSMGALPEGINDKASENFKPFYCGDSNRDCELTNVTLKTKPTSFPKNSRATFVVTNGSEDITIAWDYHVANSDDAAAIRDAFTKIIITDGVVNTTKLDIKGTFRWANSDGDHLINDQGVWTIVPYLASHISLAS